MPTDGRDAHGRFTKGNSGGPGRPPAASVHEHRAAVVQAATPEMIGGVIRKLVILALEGDVGAARLLLDRVLGRPSDTETMERLDRIEAALLDDRSTAADVRGEPAREKLRRLMGGAADEHQGPA